MRKTSILFLKLSILFVSVPLILLASYGLYSLMLNPVNPAYTWMLYPIIAGVYLSLIPLLWIFFHLYKLLGLVEEKSGSETKNRVLRKLRKGSLFFGGLYLLTEPFVFQAAQEDDAPGLILFFMIPVFFALVFSALLTLFLDKEDAAGQNRF
ncbi:DUF2975 domain-containing protein [Proteiniclasticum sp. C24MP]|uniref:DUF2975 domain-containing protein n=1 Tax=Proteiniclasticum sp. C24MP TaxID=3374101 RepID=UPI003753ECF8